MKTTVLFLLLLLPIFSPFLHATQNPDAILGYWMTTENNLKVEVYKVNGEYRGKIIWFDEKGYKAKMNDCKDDLNPQPALRNRKILGLECKTSLHYSASDEEWEGGSIYDSNSGHTYDSVVTMNSPSTITVTGYWMFTWLGKDLNFYRVSQ